MRSLAPLDIILTQDLCAVCAIDLQTVERVAAALGPPEPRIVSLNPENFDDVIDSIVVVGDAVGLHTEAQAARQSLLDRVAAIDAAVHAAFASSPAYVVLFVDRISCAGDLKPKTYIS